MKKLFVIITTVALGVSIGGGTIAQVPNRTKATRRPAANQPAVKQQAGQMDAARFRNRKPNVLWALLKRAGATQADYAAIREYAKNKLAARRTYLETIRGPLQIIRNQNATDADYAAAAGTISSARTTYMNQVLALQQTLLAKLSPRAQVAVYAAEVAHRWGPQPRLMSKDTGAVGANVIDEDIDVDIF